MYGSMLNGHWLLSCACAPGKKSCFQARPPALQNYCRKLSYKLAIPKKLDAPITIIASITLPPFYFPRYSNIPEEWVPPDPKDYQDLVCDLLLYIQPKILVYLINYIQVQICSYALSIFDFHFIASTTD